MCKCLHKGSTIGRIITKCGQGSLEGTLMLIKCERCPLAVERLEPVGNPMETWLHISSAIWSSFIWGCSLSFLYTYGQVKWCPPWPSVHSGVWVKQSVLKFHSIQKTSLYYSTQISKLLDWLTFSNWRIDILHFQFSFWFLFKDSLVQFVYWLKNSIQSHKMDVLA
jgi:hypothetical protein